MQLPFDIVLYSMFIIEMELGQKLKFISVARSRFRNTRLEDSDSHDTVI